MQKLIIITGQTATGKTKTALDYAAKTGGELINADSRQVYKYLDIITGKDKHLFREVKMNLIDLVDPTEYFSSFDFVNLAIPLIRKMVERGKTPIIVGGTYLYLKHLLYGVKTEKIPPDNLLRKKLADKSVSELQGIYKTLDLRAFNQLNNSEINNPQRLIRKIEIAKWMSFPRKRKSSSKNKLNLDNIETKFIGLKFKDKKNLRQIIKKRVEERLKMGALEEVRGLLKKGYQVSDPGLKTIGYQQLIDHLKGDLDIDAAIQIWINKEVQYAKRQYTFMKKDLNIKWLYC